MLNRHPHVVIVPESHFIPHLWQRRRRYGPGGRVERTELFLRDLISNPRFRLWGLPGELLREEMGRLGSAPSFAEAVTAPFRAYARWSNKPRWGDKTPVYVEHIPLLASLFPEARFVHVLRDGRDVALSMMDLGRLHRGGASPALVWARRVRRGRAAGRALGRERYAELRYEQLVEDPERALRPLCRFLELPYDPVMVQHREGQSELIPEPIRWMHRRLDLPPTKGLRDWRKEMSDRDVRRFQAVAGRELASFGYSAGPPPGIGDRLAAWADVAGFGARILGRRARILRGRAPARRPPAMQRADDGA